MNKLKLTARVDGRFLNSSWIKVAVNGHDCGTLRVSPKHETAVLEAINGHAELLGACHDAERTIDALLIGDSVPLAVRQAAATKLGVIRNAIARADGTTEPSRLNERMRQ
jgi:hypothetical protein